MFLYHTRIIESPLRHRVIEYEDPEINTVPVGSLGESTSVPLRQQHLKKRKQLSDDEVTIVSMAGCMVEEF